MKKNEAKRHRTTPSSSHEADIVVAAVVLCSSCSRRVCFYVVVPPSSVLPSTASRAAKPSKNRPWWRAKQARAQPPRSDVEVRRRQRGPTDTQQMQNQKKNTKRRRRRRARAERWGNRQRSMSSSMAATTALLVVVGLRVLSLSPPPTATAAFVQQRVWRAQPIGSLHPIPRFSSPVRRWRRRRRTTASIASSSAGAASSVGEDEEDCGGGSNDGCGSSNNASPSSLRDAFELASREFFSMSTAAEVYRALVRRGLEFERQRRRRRNDVDFDDRYYLRSDLERVPGCVANVRVRVVLQEPAREEKELASSSSSATAAVPDSAADAKRRDERFGRYRLVGIEGTSDAAVSRGLLSLLSSALTLKQARNDGAASGGPTVGDILDLDPNAVADLLGLRPYLSVGRNDGLASMMTIVQNQIRCLVNSANEEGNSEKVEEIQEQDEMTTAAPQAADAPVPAAPTVALLLSGGVDSSVALHLLLRKGYNVTAFYLRIWLEDELAHLGTCPWEDDYNTCRQVCDHANSAGIGTVRLETISLQTEYKDRVITHALEEARRGRTPNPDILCNSRIKFGCFYDAISQRDFDYVASGHYAALVPSPTTTDDGVDAGTMPKMRLLRAPDPIKDQSYFLCALSQQQLSRVLFPIGNLRKSEVRELAQEFQLPNRDRPDSQGLCFLGKVKFDDFLAAYLGERPGDVVDAATGDVIGRHRGIWFHTVGQRKGIGTSLFPLESSRGPWYVVAKDPEHDIVFCSNQYDESAFTDARSQVTVENIQWISGEAPFFPQDEVIESKRRLRLSMKVRHGPRIVDGYLTLPDNDDDCRSGDVVLDIPDGGLAPGQYVVFYNGTECLGGGVISERHWARFLLDRTVDDEETGTESVREENTTTAVAV